MRSIQLSHLFCEQVERFPLLATAVPAEDEQESRKEAKDDEGQEVSAGEVEVEVEHEEARGCGVRGVRQSAAEGLVGPREVEESETFTVVDVAAEGGVDNHGAGLNEQNVGDDFAGVEGFGDRFEDFDEIDKNQEDADDVSEDVVYILFLFDY